MRKPSKTRIGFKKPFAQIILLSLVTLGSQDRVFAIDWDKFTMPVSGSFSYGEMKNSEYFSARSIGVVSVEAMPSLPVGRFRVGPHLDLRYVFQLKDAANQVNSTGRSWLGGVAVRGWFNTWLYWQVAADFLGNYSFTRSTQASQDAALSQPVALRFKTGYRVSKKIPQLTIDLDLSYVRFGKVEVNGEASSSPTDQYAAGLGFTYRFGGTRSANNPMNEVDQALNKFSSGQAMELTLPSTAFASGSAVLEPEAFPTLKAVAEAVALDTDQSVLIEGHTDNTGDAAANLKLSQQRAESVKTFLVENGVKAELIDAKGFGSQYPVADNATADGRAMNRRVRILVVPTPPKPRPVQIPDSDE